MLIDSYHDFIRVTTCQFKVFFTQRDDNARQTAFKTLMKGAAHRKFISLPWRWRSIWGPGSKHLQQYRSVFNTIKPWICLNEFHSGKENVSENPSWVNQNSTSINLYLYFTLHRWRQRDRHRWRPQCTERWQWWQARYPGQLTLPTAAQQWCISHLLRGNVADEHSGTTQGSSWERSSQGEADQLRERYAKGDVLIRWLGSRAGFLRMCTYFLS